MNQKTKKVLLIVGIGTLFIVLIILAAVTSTSEQETELPPEPEQKTIPIKEGRPLRVVVTKQTEEKTVVANYHDGYFLKVPNKWDVPSFADASTGLGISFSTEEHNEREAPSSNKVEDGILLTINVHHNSENLPLEEWLQQSATAKELYPENNFEQVNHPRGDAYNSSGKVIGFSENAIENSAKDIYVLKNKMTIYTLECWATGDEFKKFREECKEAVNSFSFIE